MKLVFQQSPNQNPTLFPCREGKGFGALPSAERGPATAVEVCFSISGTYMPPMFILARHTTRFLV